jgi:hypothetical protein
MFVQSIPISSAGPELLWSNLNNLYLAMFPSLLKKKAIIFQWFVSFEECDNHTTLFGWIVSNACFADGMQRCQHVSCCSWVAVLPAVLFIRPDDRPSQRVRHEFCVFFFFRITWKKKMQDYSPACLLQTRKIVSETRRGFGVFWSNYAVLV